MTLLDKLIAAEQAASKLAAKNPNLPSRHIFIILIQHAQRELKEIGYFVENSRPINTEVRYPLYKVQPADKYDQLRYAIIYDELYCFISIIKDEKACGYSNKETEKSVKIVLDGLAAEYLGPSPDAPLKIQRILVAIKGELPTHYTLSDTFKSYGSELTQDERWEVIIMNTLIAFAFHMTVEWENRRNANRSSAPVMKIPFFRGIASLTHLIHIKTFNDMAKWLGNPDEIHDDEIMKDCTDLGRQYETILRKGFSYDRLRMSIGLILAETHYKHYQEYELKQLDQSVKNFLKNLGTDRWEKLGIESYNILEFLRETKNMNRVLDTILQNIPSNSKKSFTTYNVVLRDYYICEIDIFANYWERPQNGKYSRLITENTDCWRIDTKTHRERLGFMPLDSSIYKIIEHIFGDREDLEKRKKTEEEVKKQVKTLISEFHLLHDELSIDDEAKTTWTDEWYESSLLGWFYAVGRGKHHWPKASYPARQVSNLAGIASSLILICHLSYDPIAGKPIAFTDQDLSYPLKAGDWHVERLHMQRMQKIRTICEKCRLQESFTDVANFVFIYDTARNFVPDQETIPGKFTLFCISISCAMLVTSWTALLYITSSSNSSFMHHEIRHVMQSIIALKKIEDMVKEISQESERADRPYFPYWRLMNVALGALLPVFTVRKNSEDLTAGKWLFYIIFIVKVTLQHKEKVNSKPMTLKQLEGFIKWRKQYNLINELKTEVDKNHYENLKDYLRTYGYIGN